jgi:hypothetical protein
MAKPSGVKGVLPGCGSAMSLPKQVDNIIFTLDRKDE